MNKILYSFIIIAHNEQNTILSCIESIKKLNKLSKYEIIVINDASTDETAKIISEQMCNDKTIALHTNGRNMGRGYSRNLGVKLSKGVYVAFVDADIILPNNWLNRCIQELSNFDGVGGIAVPDGDVNYVYSKFNLIPKPIEHTTDITGNNGFFKKEIFERLPVDSKMKNGEDVDLVFRLHKAGYTTISLKDLLCIHKENKSLYSSMKWLYEQGVGANRLLFMHQNIRFPDIVALFYLSLLIICLFCTLNGIPESFFVMIVFPVIISVVHLSRKFDLRKSSISSVFFAITIHSILICCYLLGRFNIFALII